MSEAPKEVWCKPYLSYDYVEDWLDGSWSIRTNYGGIRYVRADRIEELEEKLAKAEWLLVDATVQLEEGKIKTRRNRAALIRQFLAELTGGKDE